MEDDASVTDDEAIQKAKVYFSSQGTPTWADHVAAEEEARHEKMAKLRAARLARNATLQRS